MPLEDNGEDEDSDTLVRHERPPSVPALLSPYSMLSNDEFL